MHDHPRHHAISIRACALALGLVFSAAYALVFFRALMVPASVVFACLSDFYFGINLTGGGFFVTILWGFLTGNVAGALFAWLYNQMD